MFIILLILLIIIGLMPWAIIHGANKNKPEELIELEKQEELEYFSNKNKRL